MGPGFCAPSRAMLAAQLALCGAAMCTSTAFAQLVPSVGATSAPAVDPMERAQRQADNVMRWIKVHSDKPRATAAVPAKPNEPTAPATAKAPAPAPAKPIAIAAASPAPTAESAKAAVAALPEPAVPVVAPPPVTPPAALAKAPEPPPPVEEEETPLKALAQAQPVIPRNVLASLTAGRVMVRFTVEANGSVSNPEVLSSSSRQLNKPTLAAISSWRFEPIKTARIAQVEFDFTP